MHILIVDDDENIRFVLKYNLELDGHTVTEAGNGADAIVLASSEHDLILLDVMMPIMNGIEACERLKQQPLTQKIPVVMLTAKSQANDINEALQAGADDYITKPFEPDEISSLLETKHKNILRARTQ